MKIFSTLYTKVLRWSGHRYAPFILGCVSFAEASFFPIPPEAMLIPMTLANKRNYLRYFMIASFFSVLGGVFGYMLGMFFINFIYPYIVKFGYLEHFYTMKGLFASWGFWIIFLAGFLPIPYKVFTITAGIMRVNMPVFVIASLTSRGLRYFIITVSLYKFEKNISNALRQYIDIIGWLVILSLVVFYIGYRML